MESLLIKALQVVITRIQDEFSVGRRNLRFSQIAFLLASSTGQVKQYFKAALLLSTFAWQTTPIWQVEHDGD
jgi:hypothetical protein